MGIEGQFWIENPETGRHYSLGADQGEGGALLIGRLARNDVALLDDLSVGGRHARIEQSGADLVLVPLSTTATTLLNDQPVDTPIALHEGDRIRLGNSTLIVRLGTPPVAQQSLLPQVIGRDALAADILIDHPTVSRRHALVEGMGDRLQIKDLGSTNGTFVNGEAIGSQSVIVGQGGRIDIGPFAFVVASGRLVPAEKNRDVPLLAASRLACVVTDRTSGQPLTLLDDVSIALAAGSFTCIIGESGSGKSTLIRQLSGRVAAQHGAIAVRGLDLARHFEALKQDLAYVPQDDLLHQALTLEQALGYCARLRLPIDQTPEDIASAVEGALAAVDLSARAATSIADLSGGQKKRASLACELLTRPSLLFLDEVTSGLDEATDREVMHLLARLANEGMAIVCVTHTLANIEATASKLVVMARGGIPVFDGPPREALARFDISRLGEVFDRLADPAIIAAARAHNAALPAAQPAAAMQSANQPEPTGHTIGERLRQMTVLVPRNARLKLADRRGLIMAAVQAVVIGGLLGYAFSDFGTGGQVVQSQLSLLMLLGMAALWIGCNSASQDIVGERTIFDRERDAGLSVAAFVLAKAVVTGAYTVVQLVAVLVLLWLGAQEIPGGFTTQLPLIAAGGLVGVTIGLTISAWCTTRDQANILVPLALIPQLILAGMLVPALPAFGQTVSELAVSAYWITEGLKANFIDNARPINQLDLATGSFAPLVSVGSSKAWLLLGLHALVFISAAMRGARRRPS